MKKKSESATPSRKKSVNTKTENAGAHGSKAQPKGASTAPKWPGGGKKGEDE